MYKHRTLLLPSLWEISLIFRLTILPHQIGLPTDRMACSKNPAADLTDDLIVEILSRLPTKSVCRFKCVSHHWDGLITHPDHRKKIPQTLSGFFGRNVRFDDNGIMFVPDFVSISGEGDQPVSDPSLSFLHGYRYIDPKDCCNGLLLCLCFKFAPICEADLVVCNPATEKWMILPDTVDEDDSRFIRRLCFDPAVSSHFHVFATKSYYNFDGVEIYSSEAGRWSRKRYGWAGHGPSVYESSVFLNGMLHFISVRSAIVAVDKEGETWRIIPLLETMCAGNNFPGDVAFIDQSQGRLHYLNIRKRDASTLSTWVLEDYCGGGWIFKYNISTSQLFGSKGFRHELDYTLVAIHRGCNLIFFILHRKNVLLSYDVDRGEVCIIYKLNNSFYAPFDKYLPYVPLFIESLADHE